MNDDAFIFYLLAYAVPLMAAGAGVVSARRWGRRWRLPAALLSVGAVLVIVGASVWYGSGCADSGSCQQSIGIGLEVVWLALAASLLGLLTMALLRSR